MLTLLRVKNLALVEEATVAFEPGLNIITGETGAGKSILIGALYLLLGERADTSAIRAGETQCVVEATFQLAEPQVVNDILTDTGLEPCDHGLLILRRTVKAAGGGQAFVNDAPVTLPLLKRLGAHLVDLHGPHDHQSLFQPASQLDILDSFARADAERAAYANAFSRRQALLARREELAGDRGDLDAQIALYAHQVREIEEAAPVEGEEDEVRAEQQTAGHAQRILELGQLIVQATSEDENSALAIMAPARKALDELARLLPAAKEWLAEFRGHTDALAALTGAIQSELTHISADPARLEWLDQRLATYDKLKRKYGPSLADILQTLAAAKTRLQDLQTRDQQKADVEKELLAVEKELQTAGRALRKRRAAAAEKLAPAITAELQALGFAHGLFAIELTPSEAPLASGLDKLEFAFAPNVGEPMRPLRAIASSGEISRVMLGIKVVVAAADRIPLLVFDEIDANVGGETARAVGQKLAQAAKRRQVIAITHLPTVAACGAHHHAVRKEVQAGRTHTRVVALDHAARVEELARMLGGRESTSVTLRHAAELLATTPTS
ncbi:MAG TPA: DNA repair protein RecN [Kiritimatiellia bacterium]|jgi:DNA repair protein RecN (Recombination protein N)|nr:DNA repair protein RecN [Kiritimatiellia bacterium]HOE37642.1 DNA repair protein RecN [Kiritimatiellia bacterium]HOR74974.1 DNA repair protein RecN [Kiritimatiellia bacterium]HOU59444.1 DNA repair protein RecN [Kiritimatiellia bacterium]HPK69946.1 DNA repair protein RecN [Kiritimatiellia bacterium]